MLCVNANPLKSFKFLLFVVSKSDAKTKKEPSITRTSNIVKTQRHRPSYLEISAVVSVEEPLTSTPKSTAVRIS